jgi:hypothetical protein
MSLADETPSAQSGVPKSGAADSEATDDERWLVVNGRRWRRTDPSLPEDVVAALKSHLGRGRSGVRTAQKDADDDAVAAARKRVAVLVGRHPRRQVGAGTPCPRRTGCTRRAAVHIPHEFLTLRTRTPKLGTQPASDSKVGQVSGRPC